MTRARSTNIRSLSDSTWLRMTRAVVAQLVRPITTTMTISVDRIPNNSRLRADDVEHDRREDQREHDRRQDQEEVRRCASAALSSRAAGEPGDDADQRADDDRDERGHEADRHRDPGAVDGQVEHVAARARRCRTVLRRWAARAARRSRSSTRLQRPHEQVRARSRGREHGEDRRPRSRPSVRPSRRSRSRGARRPVPASARRRAPVPASRCDAHCRTRGSR